MEAGGSGGRGGKERGTFDPRRRAPIWWLLLTYESLMLNRARSPSRLNNSFGSRSLSGRVIASPHPISLAVSQNERARVKNGLLGVPLFLHPLPRLPLTGIHKWNAKLALNDYLSEVSQDEGEGLRELRVKPFKSSVIVKCRVLLCTWNR